MSTQPRPGLDAFFDSLVPLLRGERSASETLAALGEENALVAERLALVASMSRRTREQLFEGVFAATRQAIGPARFAELVAAHLAEVGDAERDYASMALGFAERVEESGCEPHIAELADYEEILHRLRVVGAHVEPPRLRTPIFVRQYSFDVPAACRALRTGEPDKVNYKELGAAGIVAIYRDPETQKVRRVRPGAPHLALIAWARSGSDKADLAQLGLDSEQVEAAEQELVSLGLLERLR